MLSALDPLRAIPVTPAEGVPAAASNGRPAATGGPAADLGDPTPPFPLEANVAQLRVEVDLLRRQAQLNNVAIICIAASLLLLLGTLRKHAAKTVGVGDPGGIQPAAG